MKLNLYGLMIGLGILAAFRASEWLAKKRKIDKKIIENGFWWVIIGGIVGARLYHVIDLWDELYRNNPLQIIKVWEGGLGIWGAVVGGELALAIYAKTQELKKSKTQSLLTLLDVGLFGLPLGQAIGRLGNFFNQELYGRVTDLPWGILIEGQMGKFHPLFAYEAVLNLVLFGLLVLSLRSRMTTRAGVITGLYLIGYGVIRFGLEPLRPDAIVWKIVGLPTASLISILSIFLGLLFFLSKLGEKGK
ncbi:prolipoprotein diacylglyceryl transferase [Candidatus Collierbacteria bacterium]|nr:prolipoprotein diacylglyceryl transferase [Candidatus Collierbacteria bacterium]